MIRKRLLFGHQVDLPTGVTGEGSENPLRADFTYCTGIVKEPVLDPSNAEWVGRLRYLKLIFSQRIISMISNHAYYIRTLLQVAENCVRLLEIKDPWSSLFACRITINWAVQQ